MEKKILLALICGFMVLSVTGCGSKNIKESSNSTIEFDYLKIDATSKNIGKNVEVKTVLNENIKPSSYEGITFTGDTGDLNEVDLKVGNLNWVILAEDDNNYMLTTVKAPSDTIRLQGPDGYNNGVQALNSYCAKYYTVEIDGKKYIARNINMNDIEVYYKDKTDSWKQNTLGFDTYNKTGVEANKYQYYPSLYAKEIGSGMDGKLNESETPNNYEPYNDSFKSDGTSTKKYLDNYYFAYNNKIKDNFTNLEAFNIIFESGSSYYIATRTVSFYDNGISSYEVERGSRYSANSAKFGIRMITGQALTKGDLMDSSSKPDIFHKYLMSARPVVIIPKSELNL